MGSLLAKEHVLLVGVQHVSGMWVLRGMRMGAYVAALRIVAREVGRCGSLKQALQDAQQLAVGFLNGGPAAAKARRKGFGRGISGGVGKGHGAGACDLGLAVGGAGEWHERLGNATTPVCGWW